MGREKGRLLPKVLNGSLAGMIGISIVYPIDLVKTRLQSQTIGPNGERMYTSMFDCFKKTYKKEGYFGMYKGSAINITLVSPEKAIKLAANDLFKFHLHPYKGKVPISKQILAAALAALVSVVITTPMDLLKIELQNQGRLIADTAATIPKISGIALARRIFNEKGILGLYQGFWATALRDSVFCVIYFPLFSILNELGPKRQGSANEATFANNFASGLIAGGTAAWSVTPLDVVKTRLQIISKGKDVAVYKGIADAAIKIFRNEGPTAFYKGGTCRIMVIAPLFAIAQTVYYLGVAEYLLGIKK